MFANGNVLVLLYVDDILIFYRREQEPECNQVIGRLKDKYELRDEGGTKWFLGIRVLRGRTRRRVWPCHDAYCEKIAVKFGLLSGSNHSDVRFPSIHPPTTLLQRHTGQASKGAYTYSKRRSDRHCTRLLPYG